MYAVSRKKPTGFSCDIQALTRVVVILALVVKYQLFLDHSRDMLTRTQYPDIRWICVTFFGSFVMDVYFVILG